MTISTYEIAVGGLTVEVQPKHIKNLHLGVYPPSGRIRVAAPLSLTKDAVRLAVANKLSWIKRQQAKFALQERQSEREFVSGETHYFQGRRYRLCVIEHNGASQVVLKGKTTMHLLVKPNSTRENRKHILYCWYKKQLQSLAQPMIKEWALVLNVQLAECRIKKMKTKWGSCNHNSRRIWLNIELIKKPAYCLEYIILHELAHLLIKNHNNQFAKLLDEHMPKWQAYRDELNSLPLGHEYWTQQNIQ